MSLTKKTKKILKKVVSEIKRIASAWSDADVGTYGSSVAYYTIFSFAPIIVIAISIISFFISRDSATESIIAQFTSVFGSQGASFIESLLNANVSSETSIITASIGFIFILIGAGGVFSALQEGLNTIFETLPAIKGKKGFWVTVREKLLSIGMVLSIGFVLLVSLALSSIIALVTNSLGEFVPGIQVLFHILELVLSLGLISFFLALMYKVLPSHKLAWRPALTGGLLAGILFSISKYVLGSYLGSGTVSSSFGAASALVILILWAYYMAQVFFFVGIIIRLYLAKQYRHTT